MATSTGTVTLRASFANDDEALFPNEFVNVQLLVDTLHQAVLVPTPAVLSGAPGDYVYLVNADDTVSVHKVTLGPSDGKNTVIASGLAAGDMVVIDGTDRLSDGAKIKVAATAPPAARPRRSRARDSGSARIGKSRSTARGTRHRRQIPSTAQRDDEHFPPVHRAAGGDVAADDRARAGRPGRGALPAGLVAARRRLPDHPGPDLLSGRQPAGDGDHGDRAARSAARRDSRACSR